MPESRFFSVIFVLWRKTYSMAINCLCFVRVSASHPLSSLPFPHLQTLSPQHPRGEPFNLLDASTSPILSQTVHAWVSRGRLPWTCLVGTFYRTQIIQVP
ncbi:uncharacterized protein K452DRAFT_166171 [Aplosporella prunicola CBS 121167]|uniref:Uncharacterized protein n=1 Tax=Aplosporella prunicola CBS 121167 TaxID=1176127 RepID=A0A6A6AUR2_9PEZI|nr:uncharacterized protein K452DRAFT_166171 [Aplosporella prunicola CBS 121167]KAF2135679.1 hypothetical protein K452DRAFT_166171 [Aplosporella prunicola CBS 121167]